MFLKMFLLDMFFSKARKCTIRIINVAFSNRKKKRILFTYDTIDISNIRTPMQKRSVNTLIKQEVTKVL